MENQITLSKKERRALKRQEKQKRWEGQIAGKKKRKLTIILICVAVLAGITVVVNATNRSASRSEQNRPGQAYEIQGRDHIAVGASHAEYNSNPPTSGAHYAQEAEWGVHQTELPDEQLIHNLEHGGIWISYIGIDEATKKSLEKIAGSRTKVVLEPRSKNDAPIALASWGRLQKLQSFDEQAINDFIKANSNRAPEPFAQ